MVRLVTNEPGFQKREGLNHPSQDRMLSHLPDIEKLSLVDEFLDRYLK